MTKKHTDLRQRLSRLGFVREKQISLYGEEFEVVSEPIVMGDALVFVDAIEMKSGRLRRVRIPLTIVKQAAGEVRPA